MQPLRKLRSIALVAGIMAVVYGRAYGTAIDLDRGDDYVSIPDSPSLSPTQALTLEAWIEPQTTGGVVIGKYQGDFGGLNTRSYILSIVNEGRLSIDISHDGSSGNTLSAESDRGVSFGVWSHVAATYDGTTVRFYINGMEVGSATGIGGIHDGPLPVYLGRYTTNNPTMDGVLDEVRIWSVARTQEQIRQGMFAELSGSETGLEGYWKFEEQDARDYTSNGNDGTIHGSPQCLQPGAPKVTVSFSEPTSSAFFDFGTLVLTRPGNLVRRGSRIFPHSKENGDIVVAYMENRKWPRPMDARVTTIDRELGSAAPATPIYSDSDIYATTMHDGSLYIAAEYVSGGIDPLNFSRYDLSTGTVSQISSKAWWPTSAFSDHEPFLMAVPPNGKTYLLINWRYVDWAHEESDVYMTVSPDGMQTWSSWIQGRHIGGEGVVRSGSMVFDQQSNFYIGLNTLWGGNRIVFMKFDSELEDFSQRLVVDSGSFGSIFIDQDSGKLAIAYLSPEGIPLVRYSSISNPAVWSDALPIDSQRRGGIGGAGNSVSFGPFDQHISLYLWTSADEQYVYRWDGNNSWRNLGRLPKLREEEYGEYSKVIADPQGNPVVFQDYKKDDDSGYMYVTRLEGEAPADSSATISLDRVTASAGSEVAVGISLSDAAGIAGGDLTISYDSSVLTVQDARPGELLITNGITLIPNLRTADQIKISLAGAAGIPSGQGTLLTLSFTVRSGAADGDYPVSFERAVFRDETGAVIPVTREDGSVTVQSVVLGDVDGDGEVTSGDAILTLRFAAELQEPTVQQQSAADVDRDGEITSGDAILILRHAAGLIDTFANSRAGRLSPQPIQADLAQMSDEEGRITLSLTLDPIPEIAGGDLILNFDPALGRPLAVNVDGLPDDALSVVNTQVPGQIRVSFAQVRDRGQVDPLILRLLLPTPSSEQPLQIALSGCLFDAAGSYLGNLRLEQGMKTRLPSAYALLQNCPNPFNPSTTIHYTLPESGGVSLRIYSLTGQLVRTLVQGRMVPGRHSVEWDGRDETGSRVGSGIYLYRIVTNSGQYTASRRMLLLK